jgi:hypothetical protein
MHVYINTFLSKRFWQWTDIFFFFARNFKKADVSATHSPFLPVLFKLKILWTGKKGEWVAETSAFLKFLAKKKKMSVHCQNLFDKNVFI